MTFYNKPTSVDDIVDHSVGRVLDLFGIDNTLVRRWQENPGVQNAGRD
jgi:4-hydroxy-3-polyprenylbenzoate decarboxylase